MEQLALEAINIRSIIKEKSGHSVMNYLTKKAKVMSEDVKIIKDKEYGQYYKLTFVLIVGHTCLLAY
jgi:hypothetical protein